MKEIISDIHITTTEHEILKYLAQGLSNSEMAQLRHCSMHTIKIHITNLLDKFNAKNRTHLAFIVGKMSR